MSLATREIQEQKEEMARWVSLVTKVPMVIWVILVHRVLQV